MYIYIDQGVHNKRPSYVRLQIKKIAPLSLKFQVEEIDVAPYKNGRFFAHTEPPKAQY